MIVNKKVCRSCEHFDNNHVLDKSIVWWWCLAEPLNFFPMYDGDENRYVKKCPRELEHMLANESLKNEKQNNMQAMRSL